MKLPKDFIEFLELLNSASVQYLVIGGWAYNRYAEPRMTGDMDLFFYPSKATESALRAVLADFGFESALPSSSRRLFAKPIIMLGFPPQRIDLITKIDGATFKQAWKSKELGKLGRTPVYFISKALLIKNKLAAGRPKDLQDVENLRFKERGSQRDMPTKRKPREIQANKPQGRKKS